MLTEHYRTQLQVARVDPNILARLPMATIAMIPRDLAIELRAIPISIDDNNLTVALGDPSDHRAIDEIAFFTHTSVVRVLATQMQIAWCLARYYAHVTPLGQQLFHAVTPPPRAPRTKGLTAKVEASRHRGIVPVDHPPPARKRPEKRTRAGLAPPPPIQRARRKSNDNGAR